MGFKDTLKSFGNKTSDLLMNEKFTFEKDCGIFTCYSLENLDNTVKLKAKYLEGDKIQFSGNFAEETKDVSGRKFLVDPTNIIIELVPNSLVKQEEQIELKSKTVKYETTVSKYVK